LAKRERFRYLLKDLKTNVKLWLKRRILWEDYHRVWAHTKAKLDFPTGCLSWSLKSGDRCCLLRGTNWLQKISSRWKSLERVNWSNSKSLWRVFLRIGSPSWISVSQIPCLTNTIKENTPVIAMFPATECKRCQTNCAKWWQIPRQLLTF